MKISKILQTIIALFFVTTTFAQQKTGNISGKVLTLDKSPAPYINVIIKSINTGTVTNNEGLYSIKNIPYGDYTIEFSLIGMESKTIEVKVNDSEIELENIQLNENQEQLSEVTIISQRLNQFAHKESEYVAKVPLKNINNPQSYSVVTNALLKEQVNTDLASAFKSITGGGYVQSNDGNVSVYLRGFRSDVHLRNGGIAWVKAPIDPQNIERIELVKGPASLFYGANVNNIANFGGIVNKVTKQAYNGKKLDLGYIAGNYDLNRATVDYNTVLSQEKNVFFRFNGAYNNEASFQDQGIIKEFMLAPSLTVELSDKLTIKANLEYNQSKRNLNFARGVSGALISDDVNSWDDLNWDYNTNYGTNEMAGYFSSLVSQINMEYKLSNTWTSKTNFTKASSFTDANYLRVVMGDVTTVNRYYLQLDPRETQSTHIQQDFLNVIEGAKVSNKLVAGVSYLNNLDDTQRTGVWNAIDDVDTTNPVITGLTNDQFEANIAGGTKNKTITKFQTLGFYAFDAITINEQLTLTGGLRFDRFMSKNTISNGTEGTNGYNQNALSTKLGIAYNPFEDKASLFVNYMDGLNNNAPSDNGNGEIITWDAERAKQFEIGTKLDFFDGKLLSTISYYNINIDNDIIVDENGISSQTGETLSKGFEIDLIANPLPGLNLVAGYTKNNATLEKVSSGSEAVLGNSLSYTPETVWNFWLSYQVLKGEAKGLGLGCGANHMGEIYNSTANNFGSAAYTTVDATVFYKKNNYKVSFKADNIFDQEYYNGYGIPQKPFNFRVGLAYSLF
ncbi:outer membrane receptor for monomeric catechols [Bernardetia litoralis DSM 6794]|uniref:Outer membrane receptor for monomeric catechols n=1 Tax=Bernardetia litoralis (strain ATCC 23117 / DSM 6794 / NBRC 15988 / NCIMB 1366 / Fx l1 / Sio-4) TaxID=880071 RepID=I4AQ95_BERLS|nr:TonB-dependent receptor [Bernardetia litoralis]AFM06130.1 outer membrane receptor for monomeric catechols [Bernardetia litoralis DSM 6794]